MSPQVSRRCSLCALNFPDDDRFKLCLSCDEPTDRVGNVIPMPEDEAVSMLNHKLFEAFYEKWDAEQPPLEERCEPQALTTY